VATPLRHVAVPLAVVATAVALSACGGEPRRAPVQQLTTPTVAQPADSATVSDPARARYVRKVDAVCARYNPQRDDAVRQAGEASDDAAAVRDYDGSIALAERQLAAIEAVAAPSADRALIQRNVVERLRQRIALRRALSADLSASDTAGAQRDRAQLDALTIALQSFARGYGFKECGAK
jgi:hypothetical protein